MKYFTASNAERVERLMESCKRLMDKSIKTCVDMDTIGSLDSNTLDLLKDMMQMFDETCGLAVDMAKQLDEQSEMLTDMTNKMESMQSQNEEILRLLKKNKEKE